jgi:hypothetical protein
VRDTAPSEANSVLGSIVRRDPGTGRVFDGARRSRITSGVQPIASEGNHSYVSSQPNHDIHVRILRFGGRTSQAVDFSVAASQIPD